MKKIVVFLTVLSLLLLCACGESESVDSSATSGGDVSFIELSEGEVPEDISVTDTAEMDFDFSDRDSKNDYDASSVREGTYNGNVLNIAAEGTYVLSGDMTNKMVLVSGADNAKIQLVLDNVTLTNSNGPAIYIKSADKVFITAKEGTSNTISDGELYTYMDSGEKIEAAIHSECDMTINGLGSLSVSGNQKHAIVSKDELIVTSLSLDVTSKNVGLDGKDCVKTKDANIKINAGTDGVRSDNSTNSDWGFVYVNGGSLNITSGNDGIQAETVLRVNGGDINVVSGGGSGQYSASDSESKKGLKASQDILIESGVINIDSADDGIHSNNTICISEGEISISAGDDGIHADSDFSLTHAKIDIKKSYEGVEASRIFITGGELSLVAADDGLNAAGGNDDASSGQMQRPGKDNFSNGIGAIAISGGYTVVDASGDGIDSNGTISLTGGIVLVSGPTNTGNAAFDYDGNATVTGGTLIALGTMGMAQSFTNAENQGAMLVNVGSQSAGTSFAVVDSEGNCVASFTPNKGYQSAVVTSPKLVQGGSYSYIVGADVENADANGFSDNGAVSGGTTVGTVTLDTLLYGSGGMNGGGFGGGHGGGGFGGGKGNRDEWSRPEDFSMPEGMTPPDGFEGGMTPPDDFSMPEGMTPPDDFSMPEGMTPPDGFEGMTPPEMPAADNSEI